MVPVVLGARLGSRLVEALQPAFQVQDAQHRRDRLADGFVDGGRGITASLLLHIEVDPVKPGRRVAGVDRV